MKGHPKTKFHGGSQKASTPTSASLPVQQHKANIHSPSTTTIFLWNPNPNLFFTVCVWATLNMID